MTEPGREEGYTALARWLHWLAAAIVVALIPLGLLMTRLEPGATQDRLFMLHESFGVSVLGIMLFRIGQRLRGAPPPSTCLSAAERSLSTIVYHSLYVLLLATPIIGWLALSAYGLGPSFFGVAELPALLVKDEPLSKNLFAMHLGGALLIATLALLHIAGALRHLVRRDGLVSRMSLFALHR